MRWRGEEVECRVGLKSSSSLSFAKGGNPFRLENPLQNVTFEPSREKKKKNSIRAASRNKVHES